MATQMTCPQYWRCLQWLEKLADDQRAAYMNSLKECDPNKCTKAKICEGHYADKRH
jgi:ribosome biogenesis protein Tsr3